MTSTTTRSRPPRRLAVIGGALVIYLGTTALFVAFASSMLGASRGAGGALFGERVAIVELEGLIVDVDDLVREIKAYRDNAAIRAVVIRINSPGGAVAPTQELYVAIRRLRKTLLDDVHGQFIAAVADGRKLDRAEVRRFADGRVFSGSQAKALRMIDALGGLEDAVDGAATLAGLPKPPKVVGPRRRFSVVDLLRNQLGLTGLATPSLPLFKTPLYLMD